MEKKRNTALMICYYFPPLQTSGVSRSIGFSNNLNEFGWEPLVLTVKNSKDPWVHISSDSNKSYSFKIIRTLEFPLANLCDLLHGIECKIRKFLKLKEIFKNRFRDYLAFPDTQIGWFSSFKSILYSKNYDLIYVSCSPYSSSISGVITKLFTKKPLVLDFRDPWPITISKPERRNSFLGKCHLRLEKLVIKNADHVILNTAGSKKLYELRYPELESKFSFIPNGFDEITNLENEDKLGRGKPDKKFKIMHLGTFYEDRTPETLLKALSILNDPNIEFIQVGDYHELLSEYKNKITIKHIPTVPKSESIKLMSEADILYIKQAYLEDWTQNTAIAAKTYEYLTTGIPILCDAPAGDNSEIIKKYSSNSKVLTSNNEQELANLILEMKASGKKLEPSNEYLDCYNRKFLTSELVKIFNQLINN